MDVFVQKMIEVKNKIMDRMKGNKDMIFNNNNRIDFNARQCFICGKDFQAGDREVRDRLATLQVGIEAPPTMIVIYNFQ